MDRFAGIHGLLKVVKPKLGIVALLAFALNFESTNAMRLSLPPACMIQIADYIIVGEIKGISASPVLKDPFSDIYAVRIEVKDALKGHPSNMDGKLQDLIIAARHVVSEEAVIEHGQVYILFLKNSDAGLHVLNGGQGVISLGKSMAGGQMETSWVKKIEGMKESISSGNACIQADED